MNEQARPRPRVAVYSLGGTIAMTAQPDGTVVPALSAKELLDAVPQISGLDVGIEVHDFRRLPGASVTFEDLFALAAEIENAAAAGIDGVVVTQGTDTIEETSYLLDLRCRAGIPIVVTGAMRNPTIAGADGPANILAALRVASSPHAPHQSMVVFADEIHAAGRVRKSHSTSIAAFTSWPGAIGYVAEDQVVLTSAVPASPHVTGHIRSKPRTAVVTIALGDDGEVLRAVGGKVDGLVVAAFGAGHVPTACVPPLTDVAERVPVILASRTAAGPVLTKTYGFPGSESDLLARGLISAGTLTPVKAKILLHAALAVGAGKPEIQAFLRAANASAATSSATSEPRDRR